MTLPQEIGLHVPSGENMRVQLHVPRYSINQPLPNGDATFAFPQEQLGQNRMVDIADPNFMPPGQQPPAQYSSPGYPQQNAAQPGYPGYPQPSYTTPRASQTPAQPYRGRLY